MINLLGLPRAGLWQRFTSHGTAINSAAATRLRGPALSSRAPQCVQRCICIYLERCEAAGRARSPMGAMSIMASRGRPCRQRLAAAMPPHVASLAPQLLTWPPCVACCRFADQWGQKAIRRKTTGTGRMRYLKDLPRRFKNGFREGE